MLINSMNDNAKPTCRFGRAINNDWLLNYFILEDPAISRHRSLNSASRRFSSSVTPRSKRAVKSL